MQVETQHYEFDDDIKKCTNVKQKSKLDECICSIVKREGYILCDVSKKTIASDGGNYLANLLEIDIKGRTADGEKETSIFVKSMMPDFHCSDVISVPGVYKTELFAYKELTKIFNELQDDGNVPGTERFNTVKCYEESYDEAIIMENATKKGYKTSFRMDIVTLDMAEESIRQLAKLHGLSFVLEQRRPDYFANRIKPIKPAHIYGKMWNEFVDKFGKIGMECLDPDLRSKIKNKLPDILRKMEEYTTDQSIKYCLCHGDYRPNNIMAKEVSGRVTKVIALDYQLFYYGCPIIDFLYFIYTATDHQFRKAHMINLKNLYYKSLDGFLQYFDISAESVLPRKVFENLYQEKLDYGLAITFLVGPLLFVSEDKIPDVVKESILDIEFKLDDRFKDRLRDAVEELIELGYFYLKGSE